MKKILIDYIIILSLFLVVYFGWRGLEILMIGHVNPNSVDTVISWILVTSLYINIDGIRSKYFKSYKHTSDYTLALLKLIDKAEKDGMALTMECYGDAGTIGFCKEDNISSVTFGIKKHDE